MKPLDHITQHPFRRSLSAAAFAAAVGAALAPAPALAQSLVLFDDFTAGTINPNRWRGEEGRQYGGIRVEARRAVVSGQLRIEAKGYSDNASDTGTSTTRNGVIFAKSSAITSIRSTLTMRTAGVTACTANTTPSVSRARIFGFFFNAGTPQPGVNYNDVFAGIQLSRASNSADAAGVLRVTGFIGICTDDSCIASSSLGSIDMGTTTLNTPVALQVTWNAGANSFSFQRDAEAAVSLPYTVSDTLPAEFPVKRLEISNQIAHCSAARPGVNTAVDFDNVYTNSLPAQAAVLPVLPMAGEHPSVSDIIGSVN